MYLLNKVTPFLVPVFIILCSVAVWVGSKNNIEFTLIAGPIWGFVIGAFLSAVIVAKGLSPDLNLCIDYLQELWSKVTKRSSLT